MEDVTKEAVAEAATVTSDQGEVREVIGSAALRPVFLGNLSNTYTAEDVTAIFEGPQQPPAGKEDSQTRVYSPIPVDRIDLKRGYCFVFLKDAVTQQDKEQAELFVAALNGMQVNRVSQSLRAEFARGDGRVKRKEDERRRNIAPSETLFVVNFHEETTKKEDLQMLFEPFGELTRIEMKRNYAFVQFRSIAEATKAKETTNGGKLDQSVLTVEYVAQKRTDGSDGRGGGGGGNNNNNNGGNGRGGDNHNRDGGNRNRNGRGGDNRYGGGRDRGDRGGDNRGGRRNDDRRDNRRDDRDRYDDRRGGGGGNDRDRFGGGNDNRDNRGGDNRGGNDRDNRGGDNRGNDRDRSPPRGGGYNGRPRSRSRSRSPPRYGGGRRNSRSPPRGGRYDDRGGGNGMDDRNNNGRGGGNGMDDRNNNNGRGGSPGGNNNDRRGGGNSMDDRNSRGGSQGNDRRGGSPGGNNNRGRSQERDSFRGNDRGDRGRGYGP